MKFYYQCKAFIALCVAGCMVAKSVGAQVVPADQQRALEQQKQIIQQQQKIFEDLQRQEQQRLYKRGGSGLSTPQIPKVYKDTQDQPCFKVAKVDLEGASVLAGVDWQEMVMPYIDSCVTIGTVNELIRKITNYYFEKGYITSRVFVPAQDLTSGELKLKVVEGTVEDFKLNDNSLRDRMQIGAAFPGLKGKNLNLRDLEQGIDQLNRLPSNNATMTLTPGIQTGASVINVVNEAKSRFGLSLGVDNSGQESTGERKFNTRLTADNVIGIGDSWNLSLNEDTERSRRNFFSKAVSGGVSIPYGYWTLSYNKSKSSYLNTVEGINQNFQLSGDTVTDTYSVNRVLWRGRDVKTDLDLVLTYKDTEGFIEDTRLETGSRKLTTLKFGFNQLLRSTIGVVTFGIDYTQGTRFLGALKDAEHLDVDKPRAQFSKFSGDVNFTRPLKLFGVPLTYASSTRWQYSPVTLYSSERFSIGDQYSVRGFKEESLQGDSGGYISNEISYRLPVWDFNYTVNETLGSVSAYTALDLGVARVKGGKALNSEGKGYMSGVTFGIRSSGGRLNFDVAYASALKSPVFVDKNGHEVYASIKIVF